MSETVSVAEDQLRAFFERWQRLEDEKREISDHLKELFAEAKGVGFDTKVMRAVFRAEVGDKAAQDEFDALCDLYREALRPRARPARSARENIEEFRPAPAMKQGGEAASRAAHNREIAGANPAPATSFPDPHSLASTAGDAANQAPLHDSAKSDGANPIVGQAGREPGHRSVEAGQQPAVSPQDRDEPVSGEAASAEPFEPPAFLKRDHTPLRPLCRNPEDCAGYGRQHCHSCLKAAGETGEHAA